VVSWIAACGVAAAASLVAASQPTIFPSTSPGEYRFAVGRNGHSGDGQSGRDEKSKRVATSRVDEPQACSARRGRDNHALLGAISNARLPAPSVWGVATKPARAPRPGLAAAALAATPEACAGAGLAEGLVANSQANISKTVERPMLVIYRDTHGCILGRDRICHPRGPNFEQNCC
jgi:hypothetical protein